MINLSSLKAITEGADIDSALAVDSPEYLIESAFDHTMLDEAVTAKLQKYKLYFSKESREAGKLMREAKKALKKGDKAEAKKKATAAKAKYQALLKKSDEIDDDELVVVLLDVTAKTLIPMFASLYVCIGLGVGVNVASIVSGMIGYVCGITPTMNWTNNVEKNDVSKHKTVNNTPDAWKPSVSRTEAKTRMKKAIQAADSVLKAV